VRQGRGSDDWQRALAKELRQLSQQQERLLQLLDEFGDLFGSDSSGSDSDDDCRAAARLGAGCVEDPRPALLQLRKRKAADGTSPSRPAQRQEGGFVSDAAARGEVAVCLGPSCSANGAQELLRELSRHVQGAPAIDVLPCKCMGACGEGCNVRVRAAGRQPEVMTGMTRGHAAGLVERVAGLPLTGAAMVQ
jgi:hypothetical protein